MISSDLNKAEETTAAVVKVLLIDDSQAEAQLIQHTLAHVSNRQYNITVVAQREAAFLALKQDFDVCLLDYQLAGYTGLELIQGLELHQLSGPVILITGHANDEIDNAALKCGVADFLSKAEANSSLLDRSIRYACSQYQDRKQLRKAARQDQITGLLNRQTFMPKLRELISTGDIDPSSIWLLYIDLDGFKSVNDNWGHDVGDRALRHCAKQLQHALEPDTLMARYGGDELVAAIICTSDTQISETAETILDAMREPLHVDAEDIVITTSIGIARASMSPDNAQELVRLADYAMFSAKRSGRDTYCRHENTAPIFTRLRAELETDLRQALTNEQLHLEYQPQIDLISGELIGAEALARWQHPTRGAIGPDKFVSLADACGLIRPLTLWSLSDAVAALSSWVPQLPSHFRLAVNIAPAQLLNSNFPETVKLLLEQHSVPAHFLRLEITEKFFLYDNANKHLQALRDIGLSLALDDFGTGYSCLSQLARLPVDTLKIDLSFIHHMQENPRSAALVQTIISIGADLDMAVIAEGVETQAQADLLRSYGCYIMQGYLYGKSESLKDFSQRLNAEYN